MTVRNSTVYSPNYQPAPDQLDWSWAFVIFREVEGFPGYFVGTDGSAWSNVKRYKFPSGWRRIGLGRRQGYPIVDLINEDGLIHCRLHVVILETFVGPRPPGYHCCHGNGDRADARLDNLRWDTPKANSADTIRHGTQRRGERMGTAKLTDALVEEIVRDIVAGIKFGEIGRKVGIHPAGISRLARGETWGHHPAVKALIAANPGKTYERIKLTPADIEEIRRRFQNGEGVVAISRAYGVNSGTVSRITRGQYRRLVDGVMR